MILFLDFDGVLHPEPVYQAKLMFCHLPRLEAVLRDFPHVEIVISSSWKDLHPFEELQALFSADMKQRIIGVTPHWKSYPDLLEVIGDYERQIEIEAWLRTSGRESDRWIAIDDRKGWFQPSLPNLILCDSWTGMTDATEVVLRERLGKADDL